VKLPAYFQVVAARKKVFFGLNGALGEKTFKF
jgi:hypothetical protein